MPVECGDANKPTAATKPEKKATRTTAKREWAIARCPNRFTPTSGEAHRWRGLLIRNGALVYAIISVFNGFRGVARGNDGSSRSSKVKGYAHALLWSG